MKPLSGRARAAGSQAFQRLSRVDPYRAQLLSGTLGSKVEAVGNPKPEQNGLLFVGKHKGQL